MGEIPEIGKISHEIFNEMIFPCLGDGDLLGARHGKAEDDYEKSSFAGCPVCQINQKDYPTGPSWLG